jgi:hypothetical protein
METRSRELDGDTLRICNVNKENMKPEDRPKELKTALKSDVVISYWKKRP